MHHPYHSHLVVTNRHMCEDVNANKSLYGNERETPSIRATTSVTCVAARKPVPPTFPGPDGPVPGGARLVDGATDAPQRTAMPPSTRRTPPNAFSHQTLRQARSASPKSHKVHDVQTIYSGARHNSDTLRHSRLVRLASTARLA